MDLHDYQDVRILKNGEELIIRRPKIEDAQAMLKYLNKVGGESDYLLFGENEMPLSLEEEIDFIKNVNMNKESILVLGIVNDEIISISNLVSPARKRIRHTSELAISVAKSHWNIGIGNCVMEFLMNFARESDFITVVNLKVHTENKNAIKLYKKNGFEEIGIYKKFFNINGEYFDAMIMNCYIDDK